MSESPKRTLSESRTAGSVSNVSNPANSSEAFSGDPWANLDKLYSEDLDLHDREQIKGRLSDYFLLLAELKVESTQSLLAQLED